CREEQDNTTAAGRRVEVAAASSVKIEDFVSSAFAESSASGSLIVTSVRPLVVSSRTYNDAATGTFGQYVAGQPIAASVAEGEEVRLIQLASTSDFRTNIGFANATASNLQVTVKLYRADGSTLGTKSYTLAPYGFLQATRIIEKVTAEEIADAYALVSSTTPGAAYFVYASVIDNRTGDPVLILPVGRTAAASADAGWRLGAAEAAASTLSECPRPAGYLDFGPQNHRPWDVAADGGFAYLADDLGLSVYDVHEPEAPQLAGQLSMSAPGRSISVSSSLAFMTDWMSRLSIISVADPANPVLLSTLDFSLPLADLLVDGDILYVASEFDFLQLVDVSDPVHPEVISSIDLSPTAYDVFVYGVAVSEGRAYVTTWSDGLKIVDVSDPTAPVLLGSATLPGGAYRVSVVGNTAYVACRPDGLQIVDVTDPANPAVIGSLGASERSNDVLASGTTVFLADGAAGVRVIDAANPAAPVEIGHLGTAAAADKLALEETILFVVDAYWSAGYGFGLRIADVADPADPRLIGQVATPGFASALAVNGATAFVANRGAGLAIVDVSDADLPRPMSEFDTLGDVSGVALSGDLAYVADGSGGLRILDVSEPAHPELLGAAAGSPLRFAEDVAVSGSTAYLADSWNGLNVVDVSNPSDPRIVGTVDTPFWGHSVVAQGTTAYVIDYGWGLQIVDASDPTNPVVVGSLDVPGLTVDVAVSGSLAVVASFRSGLHLVDVSDPSSPTLIRGFEVPGIARGVALQGTTAFVAADWGGLLMVDVSDPTAPVLKNAVETHHPAWDLAVSPGGSTVWLTTGVTLEGVILCGHVIAPIAAFEWAPGTPRAGAPVRFVDLSRGPPDSWEWDFGDGSGHAGDANPIHAFEQAGTYTVTLTVANAMGTSAVSHQVTVVSAGNETWVPASAALSGYEGTNWRSDLEVHNPGGSQAAFSVALMERDSANLSPRTKAFTLEAGHSTRLVDVLGSAFQFSGAAALRLTPTSGRLMVTSRTYNDQPQGTYGQFIPGVPQGDAMLQGEVALLLGLAESSQYRTNLGLVNVSAVPITVVVELYLDDGTLLGTSSWPLEGYEFRQIDRVFTTVTPTTVAGGFLLATTASEGGRFFAYASVVDNRTGDPVYIPAQRIQ
ncbi:MAG: PKD domain-containing protein, partial [Acidobacteria bacterium]|nr:PKD domain-containing protein [Acidobacteriota bacterium]